MWYTRKGDDGTTKTFGCDQRVAKSSELIEALGTVDELNAWLGVCRSQAGTHPVMLGSESLAALTERIQNNLFIIQALLAGAPDKVITQNHVDQLEIWIKAIEEITPPITSFVVAGQSELGSYYDYARTVARRAERSVMRAVDENSVSVTPETLAYLNRLSSVLYAFARLCTDHDGVGEIVPRYE